jgi:hypothetical protein
MTRKTTKTLGPQDKKYPFPSLFGSHQSMVIKIFKDKVVCKDEHGTYTTDKKHLDNGLADPNRCAFGRAPHPKSG